MSATPTSLKTVDEIPPLIIKNEVALELGSKWVDLAYLYEWKPSQVKDFEDKYQAKTEQAEHFCRWVQDQAAPLSDFCSKLKSKEVGKVTIANFLEETYAVLDPINYTHMPEFVEDYTGRKEMLLKISEMFKKKSKKVCIYGLGGVGKTQLSLQYMKQKKSEVYKSRVYFFDASRGNILQSKRQLAVWLGISKFSNVSSLKMNELEKQIQIKLSTLSLCLIVFDNVENNVKYIQRMFPSQSSHHYLFTSRNKLFGMSNLPLDVFTLDESCNFISGALEYVEGVSKEDKINLSNRLGCFPLALRQAVAYIAIIAFHSPVMTVSKYIEKLTASQSEAKQLLQKDPSIPLHSSLRNVLETWLTSLKKIEQIHPSILQLLYLCAYLDGRSIPLSLFTSFLPQKKKDKTDFISLFTSFFTKEEEKKALDLDEIWDLLCRYAFIEYDNVSKSISMHELVQEIIRLHVPSKDVAGVVSRCAHLLKCAIPFDKNDYTTWPKTQLYVSHVMNVVNYLKKQKITRGEYWMISDMGWYLYLQGEYETSLELYTELYEMMKQQESEEYARELSSVLTSLGNVYTVQGKSTKAKEYFEESLKMYKKIHENKDHSDIAFTLNNLGMVYDNMGEYSKSKEYYEEALKMTRKVYDKDHPTIASTLNNLGNVYCSMGEYSKSKEYSEEALKMKRKVHDKDHPSIADTLNNLGMVYDAMGEYSKSKEYYEESLKMTRKVYDKDHPTIAITLNNLGAVYQSMGEYSKSKEFFEEALKMKRKVFAKDHPTIADTLNNLGGVYGSMGEYSKSKDYFEQSLEIYQSV